MPKAYNFLILLIFGIFFLGLGFSVPNVDSITPKATYYTDSSEVILRVNLSGLNNTKDYFFDFSAVDFTLNNCIGLNCMSKTKTISPTYSSGWIDFTFTNTNKTRSAGNVNFVFKVKESKDDCAFGDPECSASDSFSLPILSGKPSFDLFVIGENTGEGSEFNNQESISAYIEGAFNGTKNFDNPDDGSTSLNCIFKLGSYYTSNTFTINDNATTYAFGQIALNAGNLVEAEVTCGTGDNATTKSVNIERIDIEQEKNLFNKIKDFFLEY